MPQPDAFLRILPEHGGQSREQGKYVAGAPELAAEVCVTSTDHDFGPKLALYQRAGVRVHHLRGFSETDHLANPRKRVIH